MQYKLIQRSAVGGRVLPRRHSLFGTRASDWLLAASCTCTMELCTLHKLRRNERPHARIATVRVTNVYWYCSDMCIVYS